MPRAAPVKNKAHRRRDPSSEAMDEDDGDTSDVQEDGASDDKDNLLQMLAMLNELKSKKAAKTSTALQQQKKAIFKEARIEAEQMKEEGTAYLQRMLDSVEALRREQTRPDAMMQEFADRHQQRTAAQEEVLKSCDDFLGGLSSRRVILLQETGQIAMSHGARRSACRKQIKKKAKHDYEQEVEIAAIATDARELIKGWKKLVLE